jgi:N-alpha-acetyl-L-2,4-diaminobutyrate deacetylase
VAAVEAFNAPYSMIMLEIDNVGMYDTSVEDQGKTFVTTELGGGGTSTARSNAIAKKGVRNVLKHAGIMKGELDLSASVMLDMPDDDCFVFSHDDGMIEAMKDLGEEVEKGEIVARVWPVDRTGRPPLDYRARRSGILASRHFPGLVKAGDCVAVIAVKV